jgi:hypothetical protein
MFDNFLSLERKFKSGESNGVKARRDTEMGHTGFEIGYYLSTFLQVAAIVGYGVYQFYKRERTHKALIQGILEGKDPDVREITREPVPALWRLATTSVIEVMLLASIVWLVYVRSKILYGGYVTYIIASFFAVIFVFLFFVLLRDIKSYRNRH